jgi:hypothetical protein
MLMHADNRGIDHLDSGIMGTGKCVDDAAPDTSPPPPNKSVVAGGVRTKRLGQICPTHTSGEGNASLCNDGGTVDFALLDINLNGRDSHPVAEALTARGVQLVYLTGNTDHGSRDGYSDRPVLRKPFKYEDLVTIPTRLKLASVK